MAPRAGVMPLTHTRSPLLSCARPLHRPAHLEEGARLCASFLQTEDREQFLVGQRAGAVALAPFAARHAAARPQRFGQRPVSEVNTADVIEIPAPVWPVKAATAKEVLTVLT